MPEIIYYEVEQVRKVKVAANSLQDAVKIATVAFERGQDANAQLTQSNWQQANVEWGNTRSFVQDVSITAKRTD